MAEEYARFDSPDARHRLVVYRYPLPFGFPGQSGDSPGRVELQTAEGKVLDSCGVEMVQIVERPEWSRQSVYVKLVLDWSY